MATIGLKAYGTTVTVLSTELNSLANGSLSAVGATVVDNTSNLNLYIDLEVVVTFGAAPTVGGTIDVYLSTSLDGTHYEVMPAAGTALPQYNKKIGSFTIETTATAQRIHFWRVPLTPGKHQLQAVNNSGQAFPASGSTIVAYPYSMTAA